MTRTAKRTLVHINMHTVAANKKNGATEPVVTVKTYNTNVYAHEAAVLDSAGAAALRVVYRPDAPLPSGGTVWIEAYAPVTVTDPDGSSRILAATPDSPVILTVSRPAIRSNIHADTAAPVLTAHTTCGQTLHASSAAVHGPDGAVLAEVVYRPEQPLSCGARLWVQTHEQVVPTIRPDLLAVA